MRSLIIGLLILLSFADSADACGRCGRRGRSCVYYRAPYYAPVVKQAVAYPQQVQNISIVNAYPSGNTQYASVGQYASLIATDSNLAIAETSRAAQNAANALTAALRLGEANTAAVAELAKIQALTDHLRAGLSSNQQSQQSQLTLRIVQGAGGIQVEKVEDQPATHPDDPGEPPPPPNTRSLLGAKCSKCHGVELSQPKAGLYFDSGIQLAAKDALRALDVLRGNEIPEPMKPLVESLSDAEKGQLMEELLSAWKRDE